MLFRSLTDALKALTSFETANFKVIDQGDGYTGIAVKMKNGTGVASVKGTVVAISTSTEGAFIAQANTYDSVGVVAESGIADGSLCWVIFQGVAEILWKDSTAATKGNLALADAVDGRASDVANPGGGLPGTDTHSKEIGHVLQDGDALGTNRLIKVMIHFN